MQEFELTFPGDLFNAVPHLDQWLGLWCIEPTALQSLVASLEVLDLRQHLAQMASSGGQRNITGNRVDSEGVAIVKIAGPLQKHVSSFGSPASSTVLARRAIREAVADPSIGAVLLSIESPGGAAAGTKELADEVATARKTKPVFAHVTDQCASAAYWIASAAESISANLAGRVGSIGTFAIAEDLSAMATMKGIKVHVVRAGDFKGMGVPGTELTEEHLAEIQRHVTGINNLFLDSVSQGRNIALPQVSKLADGRMHASSDAKTLGLIDSVLTFDEAFDKARAVAVSRISQSKKKGSRMSDSTQIVATPQEIRSACPGATPKFILESLEAGKSIESAARAWGQELATENAALGEKYVALEAKMAELQASNSDLEAKNEALTKELEEAQKISPKIGTKPLKETTTGDGAFANASDEYWSLVGDLQMSGSTRGEAMAKVNRIKPELRQAMVEMVNSRRK